MHAAAEVFPIARNGLFGVSYPGATVADTFAEPRESTTPDAT